MTGTNEATTWAQHACAQVATRFFHCLDRSDTAGLVACMTPDGVWHRQGKALDGPAAIEAAMRDRPAGRETRHLLSNVVVELRGEAAATVHYEVSVYEQMPGAAPRHATILTGTDQLVRTPDGWRIHEKKAQPLFKFGG